MSMINLLGTFFLRAVFFSKDTPPVNDIQSFATKKIPYGFRWMMGALIYWLTKGKKGSNLNRKPVYVLHNKHAEWSMFYYELKASTINRVLASCRHYAGSIFLTFKQLI